MALPRARAFGHGLSSLRDCVSCISSGLGLREFVKIVREDKEKSVSDAATATPGIGERIRRYRNIQGRTLQDVAENSGFSRSLLSKIENGKIVPPVATLVRISAALGTHVSSLLEDQNGDDVSHATWDDAINSFVETERGYSIAPLAGHFKNKLMQPFLFRVRKGEVKEHSVTHEGEELVFVVTGSIKFRVGAVEYTLSAGDSLYFDARVAHNVMADSDEAIYLDIFVD